MSPASAKTDGADCQLYLISPPAPDLTRFPAELEAALGAGGAAAFLLRLTSPNRDEIEAATAVLRPICATYEVAFLVQTEPRLALELGADGVHLAPGGDVAAARAILGPDRILGASCGESRHDAIVAAEDGADYTAFGDPNDPPGAAQVELVQWWSEVFVLPCLIEAETAATVAPLVRAGADFIGVSAAVWQHPAGAADGVLAMRAAIDAAGMSDEGSDED